jgi:hypothetical protein
MKTLALPLERWLLLAGIALAGGHPDPAPAQERTVHPGDHVRFTLPCEAALGRGASCARSGTLVRITPDTLELLANGARESHALVSLADLEVRRFEGPGWEIPTAAGSVLGALGTYAWLHSGGSTSLCDRTRNQDAMGRRECVGLTLLGGAAGAGLGALTGRLLRTERWMPVSVGRVDLAIGWR